MQELVTLKVGPGEPDNSQFGALIQGLRIDSGMNRAALASQIELSSEYVRLIETGRRTPVVGNMGTLLTALGVSYRRDGNMVAFGNHAVIFTSRIQEGRNTDPELNRNELLGQILSLLITADDSTLRHIHDKLLKTRS